MQPLLFPRDLLKFLYWVFFKPITLDRYIHEIDPTLGPDPSMYILRRRSKEHPEFRSLISLSSFHILITPWFVSFIIPLLLVIAGFNVDWLGVVVGVAFGVCF